MNESTSLPSRSVYVEDAIQWLQSNVLPEDASTLASLPDISEFPSYTLDQWRSWFSGTARLILSKTPPQGVSIFYQSDIKSEGIWIDKAELILRAAHDEGVALLWHKIACRVAPGQTSFGRPGYSHVLCFSREVRLDPGRSTPDVIPDLGEKTWERGMGLQVCLMIGKFLRDNTSSRHLVHPFCGQGGMLAVANAFGISAIGIERSPKRAALAERLQVDIERRVWIDDECRG